MPRQEHPSTDILDQRGRWPQDAACAMRSIARSSAAVEAAARSQHRSGDEITVVLTDDAGNPARSTATGAASTSRPTCCRFLPPSRPVPGTTIAPFMLGDIVLAFETVRREAEAEAQGRSTTISAISPCTGFCI